MVDLRQICIVNLQTNTFTSGASQIIHHILRRRCHMGLIYESGGYVRMRLIIKQGERSWRCNYKGEHIEGQLRRVHAIPREQLLRYKEKNDKSERVLLVVTYSKCLPDVSKILHKHMSILIGCSRYLKKNQWQPTDRNLADTLVHGKLKRDIPRPRQACKTDCKTCSTQIGATSMCTERDVIYGLTCTEYDKVVYVDETGR